MANGEFDATGEAATSGNDEFGRTVFSGDAAAAIAKTLTTPSTEATPGSDFTPDAFGVTVNGNTAQTNPYVRVCIQDHPGKPPVRESSVSKRSAYERFAECYFCARHSRRSIRPHVDLNSAKTHANARGSGQKNLDLWFEKVIQTQYDPGHVP